LNKTEEQIKFTLNGKLISVPKGWTVMQAARREEVSIPHFCWHPGLSIAGVCRFCLVKVDGRPKLEIACNLPVSENLVVTTNTEEVKDSHKWALEFHLANHPLDCPICDQAGECKLQDYYMTTGRYKSQMQEPKVLKPKALDLGENLVLDTERCILCSRCVRFEEEVTKTGALGIFSRGDRAVIGTHKKEKIEHSYQENLVDICPVGAFTSKKFRFKQRVWFLEEKESICPGCSTGCAISVHAKPQTSQYFRIKPALDEQVNGHWMCDEGRKMLTPLQKENRLTNAFIKRKSQFTDVDTLDAIKDLSIQLNSSSSDDIVVLISAQYTCEEYESLFAFFIGDLGCKNIFQWRQEDENITAFDNILLRGDRNSNTAGLQKVFKKYKFNKKVENEFYKCEKIKAKVLIVLAPEFDKNYNVIKNIEKLSVNFAYVSLWSLNYEHTKIKGLSNILPTLGFCEKEGTFINYQGKQRKLSTPFNSFVPEAKSVLDITKDLKQQINILKK
jgi:NADH-quinone oxidoreductase subunit G